MKKIISEVNLNFVTDKKRKNETEDFHYSAPHSNSSEIDSHNYNTCPHVSDEDSNKGMDS